MKSITGVILCAAVITASAETKIRMADLPSEVQKGVQRELKGGSLVGLSKEVEKGKTFYEAETKVNGKSRDFLLDTAGALIEVEEEIEMTVLPDAARDAIRKKAGAGKITRVEALSKGGKLVAYEAAISKGAKKSEIAVTPDGAPFKD